MYKMDLVRAGICSLLKFITAYDVSMLDRAVHDRKIDIQLAVSDLFCHRCERSDAGAACDTDDIA